MGLKGSLSQSPLSPPYCCSMAFPALSPPSAPTPPLWDPLAPVFCFSLPHFIPPQLRHLMPSTIPMWVPQVFLGWVSPKSPHRVPPQSPCCPCRH